MEIVIHVVGDGKFTPFQIWRCHWS